MHQGVAVRFAIRGLEYATEENNYWVLADYVALRAAVRKRRGHGGASLEEVVVAFIELTDKRQNEIRLENCHHDKFPQKS